MSTAFTKHYFWVVARRRLSRAADKLDMAVQTVSAQVRELERSWLRPAQTSGAWLGADRRQHRRHATEGPDLSAR
jgi:hypothetical protein